MLWGRCCLELESSPLNMVETWWVWGVVCDVTSTWPSPLPSPLRLTKGRWVETVSHKVYDSCGWLHWSWPCFSLVISSQTHTSWHLWTIPYAIHILADRETVWIASWIQSVVVCVCVCVATWLLVGLHSIFTWDETSDQRVFVYDCIPVTSNKTYSLTHYI